MPYGIKDETPAQTKWMEKCVSGISGTNKRTDKPYTKGEKIAICKVQLQKSGTSEAYSEESLREQWWEFEDKIYQALQPHSQFSPSYGPYVNDIFDDYVIVDLDQKLYKVPYTVSGDDVSFDWSKSVHVERRTVYEPVSEEAERVVVTKVPDVGAKDGGRVRTMGGRTIN